VLAGVVADAELVADHEGGDLGTQLLLGVADAAEGVREIPVQMEAAIVICSVDVGGLPVSTPTNAHFSIPAETQFDAPVTPELPGNGVMAHRPCAKPRGGSVR
jgi:hypothetical protein